MSAPARLLLCLPLALSHAPAHFTTGETESHDVGLACSHLFSMYLLQVFFNGANVRQVDVPTQTGAFGILAAHVPTLQVLRPGLVVVHAEDGTTSKYFGKSSIRTEGQGWARLHIASSQSPYLLIRHWEDTLGSKPEASCSFHLQTGFG